MVCLLYTSDAADDLTRVDLGGRRIIKNRLNLDLLQIPPWVPLGPPKSAICQLWYRFQIKKTIKMESQIEKIHVPLKL